MKEEIIDEKKISEIMSEEMDKVSVPEEKESVYSEKENENDTVNVAMFGGVVVSIYQRISDFVYEKIKKSEAPDWSVADTESLNNVANEYFATLNIRMTPLWSLLITVITTEIMRYTIYSKINKKEV